MEPFKQFNVEKKAAIGTLDKLREIVRELGSMGIEIKDDLKKIAAAVESMESDVLRIALLGAFSDGKTSVIAAWLGKIEADMKIDMDESSDQLAIYKPDGLPGKCEIVDTPGLFGGKEKTIDGEQVMYEAVTKRYISEAHLIFYVVDAVTPLKESHNTIVKWVLRDLNKLSSTVFVINKMDAVTDLTEPAMFDEQATIKKDYLKSRLQKSANLSEDELATLNIVCVASDPNKRGLDFWLGKPEIYEVRSRMGDLKTVTSHVLRENVPELLIAKAGLDVVRDLVGKKIVLAQTQLQQLESYEQQNREESARIRDDLIQGRRDIKRLAGELFSDLQAMENQLVGKLRPLSLEDVRGFLEDQVGYTKESTGYKLNLKIKTAIDRFFDQSSAVTGRVMQEIGRQLDSSESFLDAMSGRALNSLGGAVKGIGGLDPGLIKGVIFGARDALASTTGVVYKFKPWGAAKLADNIIKWAGPAGAVFSLSADFYDAYKAHEREQELKAVKASITDLIQSAFKDIYDIISNDEKMFDFFAPQLKKFEEIVADMARGADLIDTNRKKLKSIRKQLSQIAPHDGMNFEEITYPVVAG